MKNQNTLTSLIILSLLGIAFLVGDFFLIKSNISFLNNSEKAEGVVIKMIRESSPDGTTYSPEVSFIDKNGKTITFVSSVSSSISSYKEGKKVPVIYNKNDSENAKINKFFQLWGAEIILAFMGLTMALLGLFAIINTIKKSKLKKYLLINGTKILAKVVSVDDNLNTISNQKSRFSYTNLNKKTYQITAQWLNPADNKIYVFKSDFINYNPADIIMGKDIGVYINQSNPQKYYVDISTLPEMGN